MHEHFFQAVWLIESEACQETRTHDICHTHEACTHHSHWLCTMHRIFHWCDSSLDLPRLNWCSCWWCPLCTVEAAVSWHFQSLSFRCSVFQLFSTKLGRVSSSVSRDSCLVRRDNHSMQVDDCELVALLLPIREEHALNCFGASLVCWRSWVFENLKNVMTQMHMWNDTYCA
jgi:hypothetical protein